MSAGPRAGPRGDGADPARAGGAAPAWGEPDRAGDRRLAALRRRRRRRRSTAARRRWGRASAPRSPGGGRGAARCRWSACALVMGDTAHARSTPARSAAAPRPYMAPPPAASGRRGARSACSTAPPRAGAWTARPAGRRDGEVATRRAGARSPTARWPATSSWRNGGSEDAPLTPAAAWTVAGHAGRQSGRPGLRHRARTDYAADLTRPGMLAGAVLRPPAFGARRLRASTRAPAEALPGVTVVRDGDFVGVGAPDRATAAARLRRDPRRVGDRAAGRAAAIFAYLRAHPAGRRAPSAGPAPSAYDDAARSAPGRAEAAADAARRRTPSPTSPTRRWKPRRAWPSGRAAADRLDRHAAALRRARASWPPRSGMPAEQVRVIVPDTGAGYGGKHTGEAAVEAARLARAAGRPVKLVWTREEEFTWAYFRPAGVIDVRGAVPTPTGRITAWEYHNYNSGLGGHRAAVRHRQPAVAYPRRASRRCARAPIARSPPRPTTSPARPTSTSSRTRPGRTRWPSACAT